MEQIKNIFDVILKILESPEAPLYLIFGGAVVILVSGTIWLLLAYPRKK